MSTTQDALAQVRLDLPHLDGGPHPDLSAKGLHLLLEAYTCVRELKADDWQFAVEIGCLRAAGLTNTFLRWLLQQGYTLQGVECTTPGAPERSFQPISNLSLPEATCFVLTQTGAAYLLAWVERPEPENALDPSRPRPAWDEARRELRVGPVVVKRFRQRATSQELVLRVFEEEGWPPRIDDPLPPTAEQDPRRRLHTTISNLNRGQRGLRVHFAGGGDGQSVCWRLLGDGPSEAKAKARRV
jgi:hypothetical protein